MLKKFFGPQIAKMVMPSQTLPDDFNRANGLLNREVYLAFSNIPSTGGATINFCELATIANLNKDIKNQKIIINAMGNFEIYEYSMKNEFVKQAMSYPNCRIVGFNFRNVQASKGIPQSEDDWIDDVIAVVDHYRKRGVQLENILLNGHSLGAAIVTMAAAKIYRQEKNNAKDPKDAKSVKLLNGRSFSSLTDEVIALILQGAGSGILGGVIYGTLGIAAASALAIASPIVTGLSIGATLIASGFTYDKLPKALIRPWVQAALSFGFGTMDALSAYKELPDDAKDYIMVKEDGVIIAPARLHDGLKPERAKRKQAIRTYLEDHVINERSKQLTAELLNMKDSKLSYPAKAVEDDEAHNAPLEQLFTTHKARKKHEQISGEDVTNNKIRRLLGFNS